MKKRAEWSPIFADKVSFVPVLGLVVLVLCRVVFVLSRVASCCTRVVPCCLVLLLMQFSSLDRI